MTDTSSQEVKNFTRGGQITLHNFRMFTQIIDKVFLFAAFIFCLVMFSVFFTKTSDYDRYVFGEYVWAKTLPIIDKDVKTEFYDVDGQKVKLKYTDLIKSHAFITSVKKTVKTVLISTISGLVVALFFITMVSIWLKMRGEKHTENILLKGDKIASAAVTKKLIKKQNMDSDLQLGSLPLIKNSETAHIIFHGTVGSGKSNAIKELLDQIRKRGDRAIIYDKSCNFLEEFFDPTKDILLNPLDERGHEWNLWNECRDSADFDSLAAAQIPMPLSSQDPFWVNAARTIFSATAYEMRKDEDKSITKLLQTLLTSDLNLIQKYLKGTEAETLTSDKIEKTAVSIKSVLATYLKSLKYVKEGDDAFSIRKWIQNDNANNWLFITSLGDRHETLKPLITAWLDIAVNSLLSLTPSQERRIWLVLDELPSLHQLPYFTQTLSESRKFGGAVVIGIQNYAQLTKLYGYDGGKEISALFNTRCMFRQPDPEIAKWSALNLGEAITDEVREGISYGANTMRDGISINRVETTKPLVSFSEIMSLPNLSAYIRLPGRYPVSVVDFKFTARAKKNTGFVQRSDFDKATLKSLDALFETIERPKKSRKIKPTDAMNEKVANDLSDELLDV